jgi:hypothetical protein
VNVDRPHPTSRSAREQLGEPELEILYVREFELVWQTLGLDGTKASSAANHRCSARSTDPPPGIRPGYYGQSDYDPPDGFVAVARALIPGVGTPVAYQEVWRDPGRARACTPRSGDRSAGRIHLPGPGRDTGLFEPTLDGSDA